MAPHQTPSRPSLFRLLFVSSSILAIVPVVEAEDEDAESCREDWQYFQGKCYYFSNTLITRFGAELSCENLNATLSTVETAEELNFVWSTMYTGSCRNLHPTRFQCDEWQRAGECGYRENQWWMKQYCRSSCGHCVPDCTDAFGDMEQCEKWSKENRCDREWMKTNCAYMCGCVKESSEGFWVETTMRFLRWLNAEINPGTGRVKDQYIQQTRLEPRNGMWLMYPSHTPAFGYVCERDLMPHVEDLPWQWPTNQIGCVYGSSPDVEAYGSLAETCYERSKAAVSFEEAVKGCSNVKLRRYLPSIADFKTNAYVTSFLSDTTPHWIGLKSDQQGKYSWVDGALLEFEQWSNVKHKPKPNSCVAMTIKHNVGVWTDYDCHESHKYICRSDRSPKNDGKICPYHWRLVRGKCHRLFNTRLSWTQARDMCKAVSGELSSVDKTTVDFFNQLSDGNVWIGLKYDKADVKYKWADGSTTMVSGESDKCDFCPWGPKQPNGNGACVRMMLGLWYREPCTSLRPFVCTAKSPTCIDDGWEIYQGYCYLVVSSETETWHAARESCIDRGKGADLASWWSERELDFIKSLLKAGRSYWVGLNDSFVELDTWADGSDLSYAYPRTEDEQVALMRLRAKARGHCYEVSDSSTGKIVPSSKVDCTKSFNYVCKRIDIDEQWLRPYTISRTFEFTNKDDGKGVNNNKPTTRQSQLVSDEPGDFIRKRRTIYLAFLAVILAVLASAYGFIMCVRCCFFGSVPIKKKDEDDCQAKEENEPEVKV